MQQFDFIAELFVAGGIASALVIAIDLFTRPQMMRIMNSVWILTGLWANIFGLLAYFWFGRARRRHNPKRAFTAATADGMLAKSIDNDNGSRKSRIVRTAGEPEMKVPGAGEPDREDPDKSKPGEKEPDDKEPDMKEPGGKEPGGFDGMRDMNGNMPGRTHSCDMTAAIPGGIAVTATMPWERDVNGNSRPGSGTGTLHETVEKRAVTDTIHFMEPDNTENTVPQGVETTQTTRTGGMAGMPGMETESETAMHPTGERGMAKIPGMEPVKDEAALTSGESVAAGMPGMETAAGTAGKDSLQMQGMPARMQRTNRTTAMDGIQGKAGTTGTYGMPGSVGNTAMEGMSGMDGKATAEGTNGTTELSGMQGTDKISGMSGMQGATGMNGMPGMQMPRRPKWQSVVLSTLHCGAGCTLADLVGEWFMYFVPIAIGGSLLAGTWVVDYALALVFGIGFQYAAIRGMERSVPRGEAVKRAAKADILSLTAWQAGMYGWMAVMLFALGDGEAMPRTSFAFWFMMQIAMAFGFLVALPVNVLLIRKGIKKGM